MSMNGFKVAVLGHNVTLTCEPHSGLGFADVFHPILINEEQITLLLSVLKSSVESILVSDFDSKAILATHSTSGSSNFKISATQNLSDGSKAVIMLRVFSSGTESIFALKMDLPTVIDPSQALTPKKYETGFVFHVQLAHHLFTCVNRDEDKAVTFSLPQKRMMIKSGRSGGSLDVKNALITFKRPDYTNADVVASFFETSGGEVLSIVDDEEQFDIENFKKAWRLMGAKDSCFHTFRIPKEKVDQVREFFNTAKSSPFLLEQFKEVAFGI